VADELSASESWSSFGPAFKACPLESEQNCEFAAFAFSETSFIDYFGGREAHYLPAICYNPNNYKLFIVRSDNARFHNYKGDLDDLLIYNRILTCEEIERLYAWDVK
jgi:hypothetical protein